MGGEDGRGPIKRGSARSWVDGKNECCCPATCAGEDDGRGPHMSSE